MISVLKQDDTLFLSSQIFYFCFLIQEDCVAFEISIQKFEWVIQKSVSAIQTSELAIQYQTETATLSIKLRQLVMLLNKQSTILTGGSLSWTLLLTFRSSHRWCSIKKLFLKISQYSLENTCVGRE